MNALVEKLLQPVSADQPCGPDLSYDPRFEELETLLKGKPEVEIGSVVRPAEPPDWVQLKGQCIAFLGTAKHLRPAVTLCAALLKVDGLAGFRDGLQLVRGLLEQYWPAIHPALDPEDNNDPQQRLNILGGLTAPRGSVMLTGWLQIADYLYATPLCRPKGVPPITLDDLLAAAQAREAPAGGEAAKGPDLAALDNQFRNARPEEIAANHEAAKQALEALQGIDGFLSTTLGTGGTISFDELQQILQQLERMLASRLPGAATVGTAAGAGAPAEAGSAAGPGAGVAVSGSIRTREDVVRVLENLCDYYRQCEPGSPVPFLLRRAQKLAIMNFVEAMQELSLATPEQLRPSMGSTVEGSVPAS